MRRQYQTSQSHGTLQDQIVWALPEKVTEVLVDGISGTRWEEHCEGVMSMDESWETA